jgi:TIR domain
MRLFICHVSEDKSDFVAPLARKLREHFDVWYDDFQLTLGDNLLQKITEGLTTSDFGVVVLSKAFFRKKKWAENELGGLFALETKTRKIILPVWKDVTEADVRSYSPILANKLAVSASEGLQKVVDEIALAVTVSQRKDELNASSASSKVKALAQTLAQRKEAEKLAYSEKGARLWARALRLSSQKSRGYLPREQARLRRSDSPSPNPCTTSSTRARDTECISA